MIRTVLFLLALPGLAAAQVSVNPGALDALKPSPPSTAAKPAAAAPARRPTAKPRLAKAPESKPGPARPGAAKGKEKPPPHRTGPVRVAPAPPPAPVLPSPTVVPAKPLPPPTPPAPVPDAASETSPIPGGLRIGFGEGKADMTAQTEAAIRSLARSLKADPAADLNVYAYAAGNADDPSTPRRLSLSRALAVRAVLIGEGIDSTRIYVRALGSSFTDGPPNRVDLARNGTP